MTPNRGGKGAGVVLGAAAVATGLVAGVFFAYVCSVMPALARSDDRVFVEVMRNINDVIQNPVFFAAFFGAPILAGVAAWQHRTTRAGAWTLLGFVLCAAVFVVTTAANVPLNDALATTKDPTAARSAFEDTWVAWNTARTILSAAALASLLMAISARKTTRRENT
ncbi:anthrone oxygenase family protein [Streptomyces narbonensis]|uniref:anthrone oxygenase family protein n=1 Tax=Streptomyces narbonensis TaxID=67333 RepID=UPI001676BE0F|nr:anthrone oxygenase family protein [Streptomyces narbonensis]